MLHSKASSMSACALAVAVAAGSACAFEVNLVDAGGIDGSVGHPIFWTPATASFTPSPSNLAPSADQIDANSRLRWDNYFALDSIGPSLGGEPSIKGDGYNSNTNITVVAPPTGPQSGFFDGYAQGVWKSDVPVQSGGSIDTVFLMNLTLRPSAGDPGTGGIYIELRDSGTHGTFIGGFVYFGVGDFSNNNGKWGTEYGLTFKRTEVSMEETNPLFGGGINYAIYLEHVVPAPPGMTAFGLLPGVLRRRRPEPRHMFNRT